VKKAVYETCRIGNNFVISTNLLLTLMVYDCFGSICHPLHSCVWLFGYDVIFYQHFGLPGPLLSGVPTYLCKVVEIHNFFGDTLIFVNLGSSDTCSYYCSKCQSILFLTSLLVFQSQRSFIHIFEFLPPFREFHQ
jgi:hypothetical protein